MEQNSATSETEPVTATGVLELLPEQGGHLRCPDDDYRAGEDDVFVPRTLARQARLRGGERITGPVQMPSARQRGLVAPQLQTVETVEGFSLVDWSRRPPFDELSERDAEVLLTLERSGGPLAARIIDLFAPIGFGNSVVVVGPPKTGQTILLQQLTAAAKANHEDLEVVFLLVDERPEEVTDRKRNLSVPVLASGSDREASGHVRLARLALARAKRRVEAGEDVLLVIDSLTRLTRALNSVARRRGSVLVGELDERPIEEATGFLRAARNIDGPGSLTVVAALQVDTGTTLDERIHESFVGVADTVVTLSRELAKSRVWPAIDVRDSGTTAFENVLSEEVANVVGELRESVEDDDLVPATKKLFGKVRAHDSNAELIAAASKRGKR